jgi:hypothetical protein
VTGQLGAVARLALFVVLLAVVFVGAYAIGAVTR